jgi:hypothetical protein
MSVQANTPWRHIGAVPYEIWQKRILDAGGTHAVSQRAVWEAAGDDSALMLAMLKMESSYASDYDAIPEWKKNPWNMQVDGVGLTFTGYVAAVNAWKERLYSPTYKNGIYKNTTSIRDLISVYAPKSDGNDTDGYIASVIRLIEQNGIVPPEGENSEMPITYGKVPMPKFVDREVPAGSKYAGQVPKGSRVIRAFIRHTAYGNLVGTDGWFHGGNALTEYMIGNSVDGAALDGQIRRFNDPSGSYYPHASGPVEQPVEDAAKFLQLWPGRINIDSVACERSGNGSTPVSNKERASRAALLAYHADQYGKYLFDKHGKDLFTWETFPIIPSELGRSFIIHHGEIYVGKRDSCPGPAMEADLNTEIAAAKKILQQYQTGSTDVPIPPEPVYAKPQPPTPGTSVVNGRTFLAVTETYKLTKDAQPRLYAEPNSAPTGPVLKAGTSVEVSHVVSDVGESADMTLVLKDGSRIPASAVA